MALSFYTKDTKWFDQFNNGQDFNSNLTKYKDNLAGYSIGRYKMQEDVIFNVRYYFSQQTVISGSQVVNLNGVDWKAEGFSVGDTVRVGYIDLDNSNTVNLIDNCEIEFIGNDGQIGFSGLPISTNTNVSALYVILTSFSTALIYNFGLVQNNEEYSNDSPITNNSMSWYGSDITNGGGAVDMIWRGTVQDSKSGSATIEHIGIDDQNYYYYFQYRVTHDFTLFPYYLDGELTDLQNGLAPDYLRGDASLKYVNRYEFRRELSNPNTSKVFAQSDNLSSVAWFNENYNGFNNLYEIGTASYQDTATSSSSDGLQVGSKTTFITTIDKPTGNVSTNHSVIAYVSKLPTQSEYTNTTSDFETNWLYDSLGADVFSTETGTGAIKEIRVGASSTTQITVEVDVEFSPAQQLLLNVGDVYVIGLGVQDNSASAGDEDGVCLLADSNDFVLSADIPDLATMPQFNIFDHEQLNDYSDYSGWNEDGIYVECKLLIQRDKQAYINTVAALLVSYNPTTGDYFELDRFDFNWNDVVSGGVQQIFYQDTRGYQPSITTEMNKVNISLRNTTSTTATYEIKFGQKITWDTTTYNPNVNGDFYDSTKPQTNLNYKASNYSNLEGYEIRLAVLTNLFGFDDLGRSGNTDYLFLSPNINVNDYDTPTDITGTIEVLDVATGTSLGTSPTVDRDSKLRLTWSKSGGITSDPSDWFINRIFDGLTAFESSSIVATTGGILKDLTVTYSGGDAIAECIIDYTKLEAGKTYSLSGRCKIGSGVSQNAKLKTDGVFKNKTDGVIKLKAV